MNGTIQSVHTSHLIHRNDPLCAHLQAYLDLTDATPLTYKGDLLDLTEIDPFVLDQARDREVRDQAEEIASAVSAQTPGLGWDFAKFGNYPGGAPFAEAPITTPTGEVYIRFGIDEHSDSSDTFRGCDWFIDVFDYNSTDYLSTVTIPALDVTAARVVAYVTAFRTAITNATFTL